MLRFSLTDREGGDNDAGHDNIGWLVEGFRALRRFHPRHPPLSLRAYEYAQARFGGKDGRHSQSGDYETRLARVDLHELRETVKGGGSV